MKRPIQLPNNLESYIKPTKLTYLHLAIILISPLSRLNALLFMPDPSGSSAPTDTHPLIPPIPLTVISVKMWKSENLQGEDE